MKYRLEVIWKNPPTPQELAMLNVLGDRTGDDRDELAAQGCEIVHTMRNVAQVAIAEIEAMEES